MSAGEWARPAWSRTSTCLAFVPPDGSAIGKGIGARFVYNSNNNNKTNNKNMNNSKKKIKNNKAVVVWLSNIDTIKMECVHLSKHKRWQVAAYVRKFRQWLVRVSSEKINTVIRVNFQRRQQNNA